MRHTIKSIGAVFAVALLFAIAGTASAQETIKRAYDVGVAGTLNIDIDMGTVRIESTSGSKVSVEMTRSVKGVSEQEEKEIFGNHEYVIESDGKNVTVESQFEKDSGGSSAWRRWNNDTRFNLDVTIWVPEAFDVRFKSGAGNITISDLNGTVRGRTGAGNITIGTINGIVEVSSGAGNIEVDGAEGEIFAESGAGNITLDRVSGVINARTGAGNVVATITRSLSGNSELESGAGNVTVYLAESVGADVEGNAGIGSAKTNYDLKIKGKWMSKSFDGSVNGGGPVLSLHSGVGNVSLQRH